MREIIQYSGCKNSLSFSEACRENMPRVIMVALGCMVLFIVFAMIFGGK